MNEFKLTENLQSENKTPLFYHRNQFYDDL